MGMAMNCCSNFLSAVIDDSVNWDGLAGIDLIGVEYLPLEDLTTKIWHKAQEASLETKAHAGEFGPASNVREVIETLSTRRIQNGIHAIEDDVVVALAIEKNVYFDTCQISNIKLGVIDRLEVHPVRKLFDRGLRCTISTYDQFSFGNTVEDEYVALSTGLNFT